MDFLRRYKAYLKDNPEGYWFKRKAYGWGWVPARWQGWVSLLCFIAVFAVMYVPFLRAAKSDGGLGDAGMTLFVAVVFVFILAMFALCYITGEPPKWQWGIPDSKE